MGACCGASTVAPEHDELAAGTLAKIRKIFHKFDADCDKQINFDELLAALRSMGHNPMPAELEHMIREVDNTNTGTVNFDEFVDLMTREWEAGNPGELIAFPPPACRFRLCVIASGMPCALLLSVSVYPLTTLLVFRSRTPRNVCNA